MLRNACKASYDTSPVVTTIRALQPYETLAKQATKKQGAWSGYSQKKDIACAMSFLSFGCPVGLEPTTFRTTI